MDPQRSNPRIRPSNLNVECNQCRTVIRYDPSNSTGLCAPCQNLLLAQMAPGTIYSDFASLGQSNNYIHSPIPPMPEVNLRRQAASSSYSSGPPDEALPGEYTSSHNRLMRRNVMGPAAETYNRFESPADKDDDEFVDAQEEVASDSGARPGEEDNGNTLMGQETEHKEDGLDIKVKQALEVEEEDEADLFSATFGAKVHEVDDDDGDDDDDDVKEVKFNGIEKASTSNERTAKYDFIQAEHARGCTNSRRLSTPPDTGNETSLRPYAPRAPDPAKDISSDLQKFKRFHDRAIEFVPRLPLAEHRYWIGVLNVGNKAKNIKSEKDFTWMKGNRLNTVETIWHMYQSTTAHEDFVLLLGFEKVEPKARVEELDYFNNKKIIFRAVEKNHPDAEGRELCTSVISKEVVPKTVAKEVIVID